MTKKEREFIKGLLIEDATFRKEKSNLFRYFNNYEKLSRNDQYEISDKITKHAIDLGWSRRKLYALMDEIALNISKMENAPENLGDDIENYIDGLTGNCSWISITRLIHDPKDQLQLSNYVRSKKWIYQDYYDDID
jgi:hypothetical protein